MKRFLLTAIGFALFFSYNSFNVSFADYEYVEVLPNKTDSKIVKKLVLDDNIVVSKNLMGNFKVLNDKYLYYLENDLGKIELKRIDKSNYKKTELLKTYDLTREFPYIDIVSFNGGYIFDKGIVDFHIDFYYKDDTDKNIYSASIKYDMCENDDKGNFMQLRYYE